MRNILPMSFVGGITKRTVWIDAPMKVIALMMFASCAIFVLIILICGKPTNQRILEKLEEVETPTKGTVEPHGNFFTEEYNGHQYVIYRYFGGRTVVSMTHSPDCQCFQQHKGKQSGN